MVLNNLTKNRCINISNQITDKVSILFNKDELLT